MKTVHYLNASENIKWELRFGLEDRQAPNSPQELLNSKFQKIAATVPGNVEIDLENAGLIADPKIGNNVYELRAFEFYRWWYRCRFEQPEIPEGCEVKPWTGPIASTSRPISTGLAT